MITIHLSLKLGRIATCMRYAFHLISRSRKKDCNKNGPLILPVSRTSSKRVSDFPYWCRQTLAVSVVTTLDKLSGEGRRVLIFKWWAAGPEFGNTRERQPRNHYFHFTDVGTGCWVSIKTFLPPGAMWSGETHLSLQNLSSLIFYYGNQIIS